MGSVSQLRVPAIENSILAALNSSGCVPPLPHSPLSVFAAVCVDTPSSQSTTCLWTVRSKIRLGTSTVAPFEWTTGSHLPLPQTISYAIMTIVVATVLFVATLVVSLVECSRHSCGRTEEKKGVFGNPRESYNGVDKYG